MCVYFFPDKKKNNFCSNERNFFERQKKMNMAQTYNYVRKLFFFSFFSRSLATCTIAVEMKWNRKKTKKIYICIVRPAIFSNHHRAPRSIKLCIWKNQREKDFGEHFFSVIICSGYFEYVLNNSNAIMKWQLIFHTATESQNEMRFVEFNAWLSTYKSREFSQIVNELSQIQRKRKRMSNERKKQNGHDYQISTFSCQSAIFQHWFILFHKQKLQSKDIF